jgi:hypothetical protein
MIRSLSDPHWTERGLDRNATWIAQTAQLVARNGHAAAAICIAADRLSRPPKANPVNATSQEPNAGEFRFNLTRINPANDRAAPRFYAAFHLMEQPTEGI